MRYLTKRRTLLLACILSLTAGTYLTIYYLAGNPKPNDVLESDKKPPAVNASGTSRSSVQTSLQQSPVKLLETKSVQVTHAGKAASSQMWDQPFNRIFYNRVPKCGSRTVHAVLRHVQRGSDRKFTLYLHPLNDMRPFSEKEQEDVAHFIMNITTPVFYLRHIYFIDFTKFGYNMPMYINLVRDPVERMLSHYYFFLNGDQSHKPHGHHPAGQKLTIQECLDARANHKQDVFCPKPYLWNEPLLYFCGHSPICSALDSTTLAIAKSNVVKHFSVVGITEDMTSFFEVLEVLVPQVFRNSTKLFINRGDLFKKQFTTTEKIRPSPKTIEFLKRQAVLEYEFYHFVQKIFYEQKSALISSR